MPIATNLDLLATANQHDRSEYTYEYTTTLEINFSKPRPTLDTSRSTSALLVKPRVYCLSEPVKRSIDFQNIDRCSHKFNLPHVGTEDWLALAVSDEYILVGGGSSTFIRLYDLQGNEKCRLDIRTYAVLDVAWSAVLNAFLIASYDRLQMYHVECRRLTSVDSSTLIDNEDDYFSSIACHKKDLFVVLSDGLESVRRLSLPDFQCLQTLSGSAVRESDSDDRIACIRANGYSIGMTLRQRDTGQWRVDLFDYWTMRRTHRGLTIGYSTGSLHSLERCMLASLSDQQWLIIGGYQVEPNALTIMDERTGEIKQIERQFDRREEFISNICTSVNAHEDEVICMIMTDDRSGRRQVHVIQQ